MTVICSSTWMLCLDGTSCTALAVFMPMRSVLCLIVKFQIRWSSVFEIPSAYTCDIKYTCTHICSKGLCCMLYTLVGQTAYIEVIWKGTCNWPKLNAFITWILENFNFQDWMLYLKREIYSYKEQEPCCKLASRTFSCSIKLN